MIRSISWMRPRVFLSYARTDVVIAKLLCETLAASDCAVWMDERELLAGDDFVQSLKEQLDRSEAIVFLLTQQSARSGWCLTELQRAVARGIVVIIVAAERDAVLPDALHRLLRDTHRVAWPESGPSLGQQIQRARRRRLLRLVKLGIAATFLSLVLTAVAWFSVSRVNQLSVQRQREEFIAQLQSTVVAWSGAEVRARLRPIRDDELLPNSLRALTEDPAKATAARINAWQALDALRDGRQSEWRTYVPKIDWAGGRLADTLWANTTYGAGTIRDLSVNRMRMAGLVFGSSPSKEKDGLTLSGVRIRDAEGWFLRIDGTQLIDVEFVNTKLRGAQLDLSGAAGVRFRSQSANNAILSTDVSIIEDSWIVQNRPAVAPGVMDMASPEQELSFEGVQFVRVRFEGTFKSEWFKNSHFTDCVFATQWRPTTTAGNGNIEEGSVFLHR